MDDGCWHRVVGSRWISGLMMHEEVAGGNMGFLYTSISLLSVRSVHADWVRVVVMTERAKAECHSSGQVEPMDGIHCQSLHTARPAPVGSLLLPRTSRKTSLEFHRRQATLGPSLAHLQIISLFREDRRNKDLLTAKLPFDYFPFPPSSTDPLHCPSFCAL